MDLSYKQELTVGGLVILAIALFVVGTTWLSGRSIGGRQDDYWHLQFRDVAGLKPSSVVRVSGVPVGRVEEIKLLDPGKVRVAISLEEGIVPRVDATAKVASVGFVGDAVVDLDPGRAAQVMPKDRVIVGAQAPGLTSLAERLGGRVDTLLVGMQALASQRTADELHATMKALQGTLKATQRTMEFYRDPTRGPTAGMAELMASLRQTSARLDSTLANPAIAHTFERTDTLMGKLTDMTGQLTSTMAQLDTLFAGIHRGEGSLGRFATDTTLYYSLRDAGESLRKLVDELRQNPGRLSPTIKACLLPFAC